MKPVEFIFVFASLLLLYPGPVLPLLVPLLFKGVSRSNFRRNLRILLVMTGMQAVFFLPFMIAEAREVPEAEHLLFIPFLTGIVLFLGSLIFTIFECAHLCSLRRQLRATVKLTDQQQES